MRSLKAHKGPMDSSQSPTDHSAPPGPSSVIADRLGIAASSACAVHCAATALVPGVLGVLGLGALLGHEAEWGFTLSAVVLAGAALWHGWRVHRSVQIALLFAAGIAGLMLSRVVEEAGIDGVGTGLGVLAGLALVAAHVSNIRATRAMARRA